MRITFKSSMKQARDIQDQLERFLKRVKIEIASDVNDLNDIKKAITSGFFPQSTRLKKYESYLTIKHPQTTLIHTSFGLYRCSYVHDELFTMNWF